MPTPLNVLLLEDRAEDAKLILHELRQAGYAPQARCVDNEVDFTAALDPALDVILADFGLPNWNGAAAAAVVRRARLDIPMIIVSGSLGDEAVAQVMKEGATDFLLKDRLARLGTAVDNAITDRRLRAEHQAAAQALRRAQEDLARLLEHSPAVLFAMKVDGPDIALTMVGEQVMTLLGFSAEEARSPGWWRSKLHPDDRAHALASVGETLQRGISRSEYRLRHKDGHDCWIDDTRRLIRPAAGRAAEIVGVWTDISERKQADALLRLQGAALTATANAIVITNGAGSIEWANPAFTHMTGYGLEEALGRNPRDLVKSGQQSRDVYEDMWTTILGGRVWQGELVNQRKDGSHYPEEQTITPLLDASGAVTHFIAVKQDLTERKEVEELMHASQRQFKAVFEQAAVGMVIAEGRAGRFIYVNRRFAEIVGYTEDELRTLTSHAITHPNDIPTDSEQSDKIGARLIPNYSREKRYRRKDGTLVWVRVFVAPLDPTDGKGELSIGVIEDIDELKRAERMQRASEERFIRQRDAIIKLAGVGATEREQLEGMLRMIAATAAQTMNCARVSVWRYNADKTVLRCLALYELATDRHSSGMELTAAAYPAYFRTLETAEVICVDDPLHDPRTSEFKSSYLQPLGITAMLDASIRVHGQVAGVLCHEQVGSPRPWQPDEQTFATALANLISLALEETQRRAAEQALRESERFTLSVLDSLIEQVAVLDPQGVIIAVNEAWRQFARDNGAAELALRAVGTSFFETCRHAANYPRGVEADAARAGIFRVLAGTTATFGLEYPCPSPAGLRWFHLRVTPLRGARRGVVVAHENITERKHSERRLKEQNEILSNSHEGVMIVNLDNEITLWNRGAEAIFGWTAAEALGQPPEKLLGVDDLGVVPALRKNALRDGFWNGELRSRNRQGEKRTIDCRITLVRDDSGTPRGRLNFLSDITEKKLLEAKYLHAQRLESLGMLAAGIAHDLNNVLAPIVFAAPMLRDALHGARDLKILDTLERSAARGAGLVKQILGFVQNTSGEFAPTQVKHLVRDIVNIAEETFPKSLCIEHHLAANLWPVLGNATQIHQVLLNLCVNARDAMPDGGVLGISVRNEPLTVAAAAAIPGGRAGSWVLLEVSDTGTGITPEVRASLWTPFFTTKAPGKGTGLGLSTVRGIVSHHQGFMDLETEVGRGSTFRVYLPVAEQDNAKDDPANVSGIPAGNGELVLLVDDDDAIRGVVTAILSASNYRVESCCNGQEAIERFALQKSDFALVVTDIDMPRMGGPALAAMILEQRPDIPVIAMSGMARTQNNAVDAAPGPEFAQAFLIKPFKVELLLRTVHALLHPAANLSQHEHHIAD